MIVVDASVLVDVVVGDGPGLEAIAAEQSAGADDALHGPELVELETLHVIRRLARRGLIAPQIATRAIHTLDRVPLVAYAHAPLRHRVWALRERLTAYDAAYVALAEGLDGSRLLTGDAALAAVARDLLGADGVRHVA